MKVMDTNHHAAVTVTSPGTYERIYMFLKHHPIGVLATTTLDKRPHATVIYFLVDEALDVYFATKNHTLKAVNLRHNPRAALVAFDPVAQASVQVTGTAEPVDDDVIRKKILSLHEEMSMLESRDDKSPLMKLDVGDYVTYRLRPRAMHMVMFSRPIIGGYDMFESVEFDGRP